MHHESDSPEKLTGNAVLEFAKKILSEHKFDEFNDQENAWFSYHYVRWLSEVFSNDPYGVYATDVDGSKMPDSIRPILAYVYGDEVHYGGDNKLFLNQDNEFDYIPPVIPNWDKLLEEHRTFVEMLQDIESNPAILGQIQMPKAYAYHGVKISFEHGYLLTNGFGLEFKLRDDQIKVVPFGARGATDSVSEYVVSNLGRNRILAKTATELGLLVAQENDYSNSRQIHPDRIDQLNRRLAGVEKITPANLTGFQQPDGLKELVISNLLDKGLLEKPH